MLFISDSYATPWTVACQAPLFMGFFQARILEWVAISFCRGSSQSRDQTCGSTELPGVLMGFSTFSSKCYVDREKISLAGECVGRMKEKAE